MLFCGSIIEAEISLPFKQIIECICLSFLSSASIGRKHFNDFWPDNFSNCQNIYQHPSRLEWYYWKENWFWVVGIGEGRWKGLDVKTSIRVAHRQHNKNLTDHKRELDIIKISTYIHSHETTLSVITKSHSYSHSSHLINFLHHPPYSSSTIVTSEYQ